MTTPIQPLPADLIGKESGADDQIAVKVNELVTRSNANDARVNDLTVRTGQVETRTSATAARADAQSLRLDSLSAKQDETTTKLTALDKRVERLESFHPVVVVPPVDPEKPPPIIDPTPLPNNWVSELPRSRVSIPYVPSTGKTYNADTDSALRNALSLAQRGDEVVVTADITGNGVYTVPSGVTVRGPNITPVGVRVTPDANPLLPKVKTLKPVPVFQAARGASDVRILCLEIGGAPTLLEAYSLVDFGNGTEPRLEDMPRRCVVDRCIVRGHDKLDVKKGVRLDGIECAVYDSWIGGIHTAFDGCAIFSSNGPGPFTVENCYLESTGENWMVGGADAKIPGVLPSDFTIDRCWSNKLAAWATDPTKQLKNLGEAKVVRRMLVTRSRFTRNVVSTQPGYALVLSATDQDRGAPWSTVEDFTMEWCEYSDIMSWANITGWVMDAERFWTRRVTLRDNLVKPLTTGPGVAVLMQRHTQGIELTRNTIERCDYGFSFESGSKLDGGIKGVRIIDNLIRAGSPFFCSDKNSTTGLEPEFDKYAPGRFVSGNQTVAFGDPLPTASTKGVNRATLASKLAGVGGA